MSLSNRARYLLQNFVPRFALESTMRNRYFGSQGSLEGTTSERFGAIYENRLWGDHASASGLGSTLEASEHVRAALPGLVKRLNVNVLLDIPCGDFFWMQHVDLGPDCRYIGGDIVDGLIAENQRRFGNDRRSFRVINVIEDPLPEADLLLVRDCFIHLTFEQIRAALTNIRRSKIRYLLTTHYPAKRHNWDIPTGKFREVNLTRWPFDLPQPLELIREDVIPDRPDHERHLGLWRVDSIVA